jgi:transcriptional regulator with XRE-family HTH domain
MRKPKTKKDREVGAVAEPSKLLRWRLDRGWTVRETADLVGLEETTYGRLEKGIRGLKPEVKVKIARALGARLRDIFEPEPVALEDLDGEEPGR